MVRRVADQRYPMYTIPSVLNRKLMDGTRHRGGFTVGDKRRQLWSPAVELFGNMGQSSRRIGEVDAVDPILRLIQRHICVQCTIDLAMRKDTFPGASANSEPPPTSSALAL